MYNQEESSLNLQQKQFFLLLVQLYFLIFLCKVKQQQVATEVVWVLAKEDVLDATEHVQDRAPVLALVHVTAKLLKGKIFIINYINK